MLRSRASAHSPRYDALPWTQARIEEGTASVGPWVALETKNLSPVDADPSNPATRNFTTQLATADDLWYRIVFLDASGDVGQPTYPIQNVAPIRPVYASTSELALLLRVRENDRHDALRRVLESAAAEIDSEIGTADINWCCASLRLAAGARRRGQPRAGGGALAADAIALRDHRPRRGHGRDLHRPRLLGSARAQARTAEGVVGHCLSILAIMQALAEQIESELAPLGTADPLIEQLQVNALLNPNPSPPAIDVYPAPRLPGGASATARATTR